MVEADYVGDWSDLLGVERLDELALLNNLWVKIERPQLRLWSKARGLSGPGFFLGEAANLQGVF